MRRIGKIFYEEQGLTKAIHSEVCKGGGVAVGELAQELRALVALP